MIHTPQLFRPAEGGVWHKLQTEGNFTIGLEGSSLKISQMGGGREGGREGAVCSYTQVYSATDKKSVIQSKKDMHVPTCTCTCSLYATIVL